jgi:hypothetical protein
MTATSQVPRWFPLRNERGWWGMELRFKGFLLKVAPAVLLAIIALATQTYFK